MYSSYSIAQYPWLKESSFLQLRCPPGGIFGLGQGFDTGSPETVCLFGRFTLGPGWSLENTLALFDGFYCSGCVSAEFECR